MAALIPRKGHDILFARSRRCQPQLAAHAPAAPTAIRTNEREASCCAEGLGDRVWLGGEMNAATLAVHYDSADIFVLPTLYEGYGMAVAEALARGLPVGQHRHRRD